MDGRVVWYATRLVRSAVFRVLIVAGVLFFLDAVIVWGWIELDSARSAATRALQGSTLLFTIASALAIALFTNSVHGRRREYSRQVSLLRDRLEAFLDAHGSSGDDDVRRITDEYVVPLLFLGDHEWHALDPVLAIRRDTDGLLTEAGGAAQDRDRLFIPRYLLRIEDELNELGTLFVARMGTGLFRDLIGGAFSLIAFGIIALAVAYLTPSGHIGDWVSFNLSVSTICLSVLELLLLVTWLRQEAYEEFPQEWESMADARGGTLLFAEYVEEVDRAAGEEV